MTTYSQVQTLCQVNKRFHRSGEDVICSNVDLASGDAIQEPFPFPCNLLETDLGCKSRVFPHADYSRSIDHAKSLITH
jgi:hypothetical protein